jgi:hypothetical protein
MTVKELIKELKKMPREARVFHIWDGEPRTEIQSVWKTKKGVMTMDKDEPIYNEEYRPSNYKGYKP